MLDYCAHVAVNAINDWKHLNILDKLPVFSFILNPLDFFLIDKPTFFRYLKKDVCPDSS